MQYPTPSPAPNSNQRQRNNNGIGGYGAQNNFHQGQQQQQPAANVPPQQGAGSWNSNSFDSFAKAALNAGGEGGNDGMNNLVRDAGIKYARSMGESTLAKYMPGLYVL